MTKKNLTTNLLLALLAVTLLTLCVRSVMGEARSNHRPTTEHAYRE